jgi:glycosyltransferase involved in cell wall biosynthesis
MRILLLSTWFPYPPYQGSKLRAYYLLKGLAKNHEVALVSFEDVALEPDWVEHMKQICPVVETLPRRPFAASWIKTLQGWFSLRPSAVVAIYSQEMAGLVRRVAGEWRPDLVVALTFVTAPYALEVAGMAKIVDIDNLMTRMLYEAYLAERMPLIRLRRRLAYKKFQRYESWLYPQFDISLAVTGADQQLAGELLHLPPERIAVVKNGVDTTANPFRMVEPVPNTLVFNGALTYQANFDAMNFFLREILPQIAHEIPGVQISITGKTEGVSLNKLPLDGHVRFTGFLDDIRPAVAGSWACVVPLRIGGGTRLKVLEAMALGTPVVSTSKGAEGLNVQDGVHLLIADTPQEFAAQVVRLLRHPELRDALAGKAVELVREQYDWTRIGEQFCQVAENLVISNRKDK